MPCLWGNAAPGNERGQARARDLDRPVVGKNQRRGPHGVGKSGIPRQPADGFLRRLTPAPDKA
jgi:hypothetical protein